MARALGRLYRRLGAWYISVLVLAVVLVAFVLVTTVAYVAVSRYLALPRSAFAEVWSVGVIGVEAGILFAAVIVLYLTRPALRWMNGRKDEEDAASAWAAAVRLPSRLISVGPLPLAIGATPAIRQLSALADASWYTLAAISVGAAVVMALGIALSMVAAETLMRPVVSEIDAMFPLTGATVVVPPRSLRRRIIVSSLCVVYISAWLSMGLTAQTVSPGTRLGLTIVAGVTVSATFGLVLTLALSQSLFGPLRELVAATRRVSGGELATRVPLVSRDELGDLARSFNEMTRGLTEREALRSALGVYVEPGIAERLLAEGEVLQGEEVDVTIMFVDIVGFSARAECMPADVICAELNEFFGIVVPLVEENGGHTNKLIGDGLLAVFGTPMKIDDHADRALAAACAIESALGARYRGSLRAGIGLHTGSVVVGTMGGGSKLDFTLIGDAVNVAARVEALTRQTGDGILVTEAVKDALRRRNVLLSSRGTEYVRGRSEPISIYAATARVPA